MNAKSFKPETEAQTNVRLLSNAACAAANAVTAAERRDADETELESLRAAESAAMIAWNQARIALVVAQS